MKKLSFKLFTLCVIVFIVMDIIQMLYAPVTRSALISSDFMNLIMIVGIWWRSWNEYKESNSE